jgi:CheY-like chemotaxis protein
MPFRAAILIVSDSIEGCACPLSTFESAGYAVSLVGEAEDALAALARERHVIAVIDMDAAGADGLDICRAISSFDRKAPKIIAVSSNSGLSSKLDCFLAGANWFLSKPVQTIELFDKISYIESFIEYSIDEDGARGSNMA